jgi:hypothetical protein
VNHNFKETLKTPNNSIRKWKESKSNLQNEDEEYKTEVETDEDVEEKTAMVKMKQSDEWWERVEEKHDGI